jgi:branched-chain amino acid transport system ATP-binding protein
MAFLEVDDIKTFYGNIQALKGVSLTVEEGECVTLIGSNGAGKSTTLRSISGLTPPREGAIRLAGDPIEHLPPQEIVRLCVCQSPEGRKCFQRMTVRENLELGAAASRAGRVRQAETRDWVLELFPRLRERSGQLAGTLSGGEQQMCAIARGLMARPRLLMLDEPSLGLGPVVVRMIFENLNRINREGTALLLVEQNVPRALELSRRAYVLENGTVALTGSSAELLGNPHVKQAYLGL